jgi:glycosyltransferase involved in cell wall biosynthesis
MTAERRGRLLFLSPVVPADRGNGLAMRIGFFLDAYSRHFDIDLAVVPLLAAPGDATGFLRARVRRMEIFERPAPDSHFALVAAVNDPAAKLAAFRRYGRPSLASFADAASRHALAHWVAAERYDVVHVARLYLAALAEPWMTPRPRLVIDCDEDDAEAYRRLAAIERRHDRQRQAAWAEAEADAFARMAQEVLARFDIVFAASQAEATSLSARGGRVVVVPNVAPAAARQAPRRRSAGKTVLFVGTMGYMPNEEAARWFVTRVWPRLRRAVATPLRLVLVGSNPSASLVRLGRRRDMLVTGTVRDIAPFYRDADLAVIPIRAGGGTRIKLLEAAALGVPIVSTTLGAEGLTFRHGRELLLADSGEKFARACAALLRHSGQAEQLATRARRRVMRDYHAGRWVRHVSELVADLDNGRDEDQCRKS